MDKFLIFSFLRMNPPTKGHGLVIDHVLELSKIYNCDYKIVLSKSCDKDKNPLKPNKKLAFVESFWPDVNFEMASSEYPSLIHQIKRFNSLYNKIIIVCGYDRYDDYHHLITKYNHIEYKYDYISLALAGGIKSRNAISASMMRDFVKTNQYDKFMEGAPNKGLISSIMYSELYK
jgi:hypothetical protein